MSNALDRDPLATLMPRDADADRPWLVFYARGERIELTGHVLAMWSSKIAGFLTSEVSEGARVALALPPHWRSVVWALGIWQSGGVVISDGERTAGAGGSPSGGVLSGGAELSEPSGSPYGGALPGGALSSSAGRLADAGVAFEEATLPEADVQTLLPRASLALRWEGPSGEELPPLVFDGVADVTPYPDRMPAQPWPANLPCLSVCERELSRVQLREWVDARVTELSGEADAAGQEPARQGAAGQNLARQGAAGQNPARQGASWQGAANLGPVGQGAARREPSGQGAAAADTNKADASTTDTTEPRHARALMTDASSLPTCLRDCLAAWSLGRTAVIVDAEAPTELCDVAMKQESAR